MRRTKTLLAFLVPLLLLASWVLKQDVWYPVQAFAFDAEGTTLWTLHRTRGVWTPGTIKRWDLRTGCLLGERTGVESPCLVVSSDERMLVTGGWNSGLQFWDARTLEEIRTPLTGKQTVTPLGLSGKHLLVQHSVPSRVELLDVKTGELLEVIEPVPARNFSEVRIARDNATFAIRHFTNGPTPPTPMFTYHTAGQRPELHHKWDATPWALSPEGEYMLVIPDGPGNRRLPLLECRRVSDNEALWKVPAADNLSCAFLFDSGRVAFSDMQGQVEIRDVATGQVLNRWSSANWTYFSHLSHPPRNNLWLGNRFVEQNAADERGRGPIQVIDLLSGRRMMTLPMDERRYLVLLLISSLLVVVWCGAWVIRSQPARQSAPLLDAGLVHMVILTLLGIRAFTVESSQHLLASVTWLLFGQLAALTCLAAIWTAFAPQRWLIRVAACTAFLALAVAGLMIAWTGDDLFIWLAVIAATSLVSCSTGLLVLLKRRGWLLVSTRNLTPSAEQNRFRFPLMDVMLLVAAFGTFFAAARFFVPSALSPWMWCYLALEGFAFSLLAPICLWTVLGTSALLLRGSIFMAVALSSFLIAFGPFSGQSLLPWWWHFATHAMAAMHIMWTLSVFRMHGYRFAKGIRSTVHLRADSNGTSPLLV